MRPFYRRFIGRRSALVRSDRPLRVVADDARYSQAVDLVCKRPSCPRPVPIRSGRGAPLEYCSDGCRTAAKREYLAAVKQLRRAEETVRQFGRDDQRRSDAGPDALTPQAVAVLALARHMLATDDGTGSGPWRSVLEHLVAALTPSQSQ